MDISYYKKFEPFWGSWHIVKLLGEGAFGKVFQIERKEFDVCYTSALKVISIPGSESEWESTRAEGMDEAATAEYYRSFVKEIVAEIALMSKLRGNSNIVSYEDHMVLDRENGHGWDIFIRMELLTPFLSIIPGDRSFDREKTVKLGIDICKALEICHAKKIIHRDVKPENIFLSPNGDYKLGDFGIARIAEKTTGAFSKKGTYSYMAPEVYKNEPYDASVDIYSLGLVLFRLMNRNRLPFLPEYPSPITHSARENALEKRISGAALPRPVDSDQALADIIEKACAYNPKERFHSAEEMRQALECLENSVDFAESDDKKSSEFEPVTVSQKKYEQDERTVAVFNRPIVDAMPKAADKTIFKDTEDKAKEEIKREKTGSNVLSQKLNIFPLIVCVVYGIISSAVLYFAYDDWFILWSLLSVIAVLSLPIGWTIGVELIFSVIVEAFVYDTGFLDAGDDIFRFIVVFIVTLICTLSVKLLFDKLLIKLKLPGYALCSLLCLFYNIVLMAYKIHDSFLVVFSIWLWMENIVWILVFAIFGFIAAFVIWTLDKKNKE